MTNHVNLATAPQILSNHYLHPGNSCHYWSRTTDSNGYGVIYSQSKKYKAHRFSYWFNNCVDEHPDYLTWEQHNKDTIIHHTCENLICINPEHLQATTRGEHMTIHKANVGIKIGPSEVWVILNSSESNLSLAERFGITRRHVNSIRNGTRWTHYEQPDSPQVLTLCCKVSQ